MRKRLVGPATVRIRTGGPKAGYCKLKLYARAPEQARDGSYFGTMASRGLVTVTCRDESNESRGK